MLTLNSQAIEPIAQVFGRLEPKEEIRDSQSIELFKSVQSDEKSEKEESKTLSERVDEYIKDKRREIPESTSYMDDPKLQEMVIALQARDMEVRIHELAHQSAGAGTGGASFSYQQGPDGKMYAIGGEVSIDMSTGNTPEETVAKMQAVKVAALAPSDPSPQDLKVASTATQIESQARSEMQKEMQESFKEGVDKKIEEKEEFAKEKEES